MSAPPGHRIQVARYGHPSTALGNSTSTACAQHERPPGADGPLLVDWNQQNELCDNGHLDTGPFDTEQWPGVHVPDAMADS